MQFANFFAVLLLSLPLAKCCFFPFQGFGTQTPTTTPTPVSAKSTRSRFYLEIEEGPDHVTSTIKQIDPPPAQSHTLDPGELAIFDIIDNESLRTPESPLIQSQLAGSEVEEELSPMDADIRKDWQGNCNAKHWGVCSKMEEIHVLNVANKTKDGNTISLPLHLKCVDLNVTCLSNGWTVNRCQLICMSKCNKEMLQKYDEFVAHYGPCNYT